MNFEKYKNELSYPLIDDYTLYNVYFEGNCIEYKKTKSELANKYGIFWLGQQLHEKIFDKEGYDTKRNEYNKHEADLEELFKHDLFEEFDVLDNPKREKCYDLAYEHGHSSGYNEIYHYFSEFVELII